MKTKFLRRTWLGPISLCILIFYINCDHFCDSQVETVFTIENQTGRTLNLTVCNHGYSTKTLEIDSGATPIEYGLGVRVEARAYPGKSCDGSMDKVAKQKYSIMSIMSDSQDQVKLCHDTRMDINKYYIIESYEECAEGLYERKIVSECAWGNKDYPPWK